MIQRLSHTALYVENQADAIRFYTEKLGFEIRTDNTLEGFRWVTVSPKGQGQPDHEIVLMEPMPGFMYDEATAQTIRKLIKQGALGAGVFTVDDCRKTFEELKAKGVEFLSEPQERPYGIEAVLRDNSGNWFSMTQPRG
jgi:catechol 2,3-dioxygenase-like lactoylglutathione lyase family enzyme